MKNSIIYFLLCTFLFLSKISNAQYIPVAVDSAVWKMGCGFDPFTGNFSSYYVQYTDGDTMVNNIQYYKVYSKSSHNPSANWRLELLVRDNIFTHTVHGIYFTPNSSSCTDLTDVLLFDFNPAYSAGASIMNCASSTHIYDIDTINIYGMDRRIFKSSTGDWIEGVGSSTLGLHPLYAVDCRLLDYCRGTPEDCGAYTWVSTKDIRTYQQGKLYPNPARTQSKLELQSYLENGKIQIFNLLGQLQQEQYFNGQEAILDVSQLNQGMYMIQVFDDEQLVFGEKLLVID